MTEEPTEVGRGSMGDDLQGPPGGRIFSLEGRRAPSLYLIAWVLSVGGLALLFAGIGATPGFGRSALLFIGATALGIGLLFAAGYQVVERQDRHPERYRGPAPLLVFGFVFAWTTILSSLLGAFGVIDAVSLTPFTFLGVLVATAVTYVVVVWLFVVRTGALSWRDMGWPARGAGVVRRILRAAGPAIAITLPTTLGILIFGSVVGQLLDVTAEDPLPDAATSLDALAIALGVAIVAPVGEELFFRGFALTAWLRDLGVRAAIVRTAVLFAVVHIATITSTSFDEGAAQALLRFVVILPLGLVLGWLFVRYGMVGAIAGHVTYNTFLLVLLLIGSLARDQPQP